MKELTAKQQVIWDLCQPVEVGGGGKTYKEAGAIVGVSHSVVHKTLQACQKKKGISYGGVGHPPTELKNPTQAAAILDAATDPRYKSLQEAYDAIGLPAVGYGVIKRLRVKMHDAVTETRNVQARDLSEMLGKTIVRAIGYMDDKVMSEASFRDLAMGTAQLVEKKQLVDGLPTQIISDVERKKLNELAPLLIAEMQRRGIGQQEMRTVEGEVIEQPA